MRDLSAWLARLSKDLRAEGFPEQIMPVAEFCRVELGLYFLTRHFPGEPVGVLQPVLSGYVQGSDDIDAMTRRVRHRMGDVARRGYWRKLLNQYMRLPDAMRGFDRTDDPPAASTTAPSSPPAPRRRAPGVRTPTLRRWPTRWPTGRPASIPRLRPGSDTRSPQREPPSTSASPNGCQRPPRCR